MRKAFRLLAFFLITSFYSFSQQYSIYQNITTSNGLPSNYIFGVCEDANGFLWVGSDKGLCRFDGFRWKVWDKDNGLPGNYVSKVWADNKDGIWMEISEKGYYHFSAKTGARRLMLPDKSFVTGISHLEGQKVYCTSNNKLTATLEAAVFDAANATQPEIIYSAKDKVGMQVHADWSNKKIYVTSTNADATWRKEKTITSKWPVQYIQLQEKDSVLTYVSATKIITSSDVLSISAQGTVLQRFPLKIREPLRNALYASDSVFITNTHIYKFSADGKVVFKHQLFDSSNNYANNLVTKNGIYVYNIKTGYYFIKPDGSREFFNRSNGLGTDYVNHIYETKNGSLIISTLGAGLQLIKNNYRKTFYTDDKLVRTIIQVNNGWYVLAGDRLFKTTSAQQTMFDMGSAGTSTLTMFKTGDTILIGSLQGISFYKNGSSLKSPFRFYELTAGISSIIKHNGDFLAGTYGNGLVRFNHKKISPPSIAEPMRIVEKIYSTSKGYALLSYEDGVILVDTIAKTNTHLTNTNGLISSSVYSLYNGNDTFWIGTKGGVNVFANNRITQRIRFTNQYKNDNVICFFRDKLNRAWAVSNKFLFSSDGNVLQPIASHPLCAEDDIITAASYNVETGELAVGSNNTFSIINIAAINPEKTALPPSLLHVRVDGNLQSGETVKVPYQFEKIEFEIAPRSTSSFSKTQYYYKLTGRDESWIEIQDSLSVSFSALRPGSYQLFTKTINADGFESAEAEVIKFVVEKPFWQQWPFLLFCVAATIALTAIVSKEIENAKRRKKELKAAMQASLQNERERISKDLHDHLGANLATIIAQTDNIEARLYKGDLENATTTVQHLSSQTRETMNVLRETIWAVQEAEHTLDEFIIRIRTFLQRVFDSTQVNWEVKSHVEEEIKLTPTQTLHLFRVIQEASQNIMKHSQATVVAYEFAASPYQLHVSITDNGKGFKNSPGNTNGLLNMKERIQTLRGEVDIDGTKGTSINISFPL